MGHIRFWRRFKILPFVWLNISKSGISLSFGVTGAKFTIGPKGHRKTLGLSGTGLFYTDYSSWEKDSSSEEKAITNSKLNLSDLKKQIVGVEDGKKKGE